MKAQWKYIVGIVFVFIIVIFSVLNVDKVEVNYLFGHAEWPLILIIIGAFFIGSVTTGILSSVKITSLNKEMKQMQKQKNSFVKKE